MMSGISSTRRGCTAAVTVLCLISLTSGALAAYEAMNLQELRKATLNNNTVSFIPNFTLPHLGARSFTNFSLPTLTLENVGFSKAPHYGRRLAQEEECKFRPNVFLKGGGVDQGPKRIKNVPTPENCCARCAYIPGCEAWSYNKKSRVCFPKAKDGWKIMRSTLHTTGFPASKEVKGPAPVPIANTANTDAGKLYWQGKLTVGNHALNGFAKFIKTIQDADNKMVIKDPTGGNAPVIRSRYNAGCWSPSAKCGGGVLFYAYPNGQTGSIGDSARLEYEVFFPTDFPWEKGGKLPGLFGGDTGCAGGADAAEKKCWSVRLMWRREGDGEAYVYVDNDAQHSNICKGPGTVCDEDAGISLNRGAFKFRKGKWNRIALTIRMNDVGKKNGVLQVDVDGKNEILNEQMVFRTSRSPTLDIDGLVFATWYGGGDDSWAPDSRQEAYWRNFKIFRLEEDS